MANFSKVATVGGDTVGLLRKAKHQSRVCKLDDVDNNWLVKTEELCDVRPAAMTQEDIDFAKSKLAASEPTVILTSETTPQEAAELMAMEPFSTFKPVITLKNVKVAQNMSQETLAFTASVWVAGKKVGLADNKGCGGPTRCNVVPLALQRQLEAYCEALEPIKLEINAGEFKDYPQSLESVIDGLVEASETAKWNKRQCRNKTLFRLNGDTKGSYRVIGAKYSQRVKDHLVTKHGDQIEIILNETI